MVFQVLYGFPADVWQLGQTPTFSMNSVFWTHLCCCLWTDLYSFLDVNCNGMNVSYSGGCVASSVKAPLSGRLDTPWPVHACTHTGAPAPTPHTFIHIEKRACRCKLMKSLWRIPPSQSQRCRFKIGFTARMACVKTLLVRTRSWGNTVTMPISLCNYYLLRCRVPTCAANSGRRGAQWKTRQESATEARHDSFCRCRWRHCNRAVRRHVHQHHSQRPR